MNKSSRKRAKKNTRVLVCWYDIVADLHTETDIEPILAHSVGWVDSHTKKYLRLFTTKYIGDIKTADKIVIPVGCIESIEEI